MSRGGVVSSRSERSSPASVDMSFPPSEKRLSAAALVRVAAILIPAAAAAAAAVEVDVAEQSVQCVLGYRR